MDRAIKKRWLRALRSGRYKQGENYLFNSDSGAFCCLGVLCAIQRFPIRKAKRMMTSKLPEERLYAGLKFRDCETLANMNDGRGDGAPKSFKEIAIYIEKHF